MDNYLITGQGQHFGRELLGVLGECRKASGNLCIFNPEACFAREAVPSDKK